MLYVVNIVLCRGRGAPAGVFEADGAVLKLDSTKTARAAFHSDFIQQANKQTSFFIIHPRR